MELTDIAKLAEQGESNCIEFKKSTASLQSACETLVAFLNGEGGHVLIGVADDGRLIGQAVNDGVVRSIADELAKVEPTPIVDICYVDRNAEQIIIALCVESGKHKPYIYKGRAFHRIQSTTQRMSQHRYEQLLIERGQLNYSWESSPDTKYSLGDLDHELIQKTMMDGIAKHRVPALASRETLAELLDHFDLLVDGALTRAAVVLFGKKLSAQYGQCWLKLARFKGEDHLGDILDHTQVRCNLFEMLDTAEQFVRKHIPIEGHLPEGQFERQDRYKIPMLAVREALINAICHRDYADPAGYISVAINDHAIEIWNNGALPKQLSIESLSGKHNSILRNALISKVFYLRGYIETWGTGTVKIIQNCMDYGLPTPTFEENTGGLLVTLRTREKQVLQALSLSERQSSILSLLEEQPLLSSSEVLRGLDSSVTARSVRSDLAYLQQRGLVAMEGQGRGARWRKV